MELIRVAAHTHNKIAKNKRVGVRTVVFYLLALTILRREGERSRSTIDPSTNELEAEGNDTKNKKWEPWGPFFCVKL